MTTTGTGTGAGAAAEVAWSGADLRADRAWSAALTDDERRGLRVEARSAAPGAVRAHLRDVVLGGCRERGFAHVRNVVHAGDAGPAQEAEVTAMVTAVLPDLGEIVPQNGRGDLTQVLRDVDGDGLTTLGYHCDTSDLLVLLCLQPAADGGGLTRLAHARHVADAVGREHPDALAVLRRDFAFDRRGRAGEQVVVRPIFRMLPGGVVDCYYQSRTVRSGTWGPPLTAAQLDALALLDEVLQRPGTGFGLRLEAGDLLVIRNSRVLHGRSPFTDEPGPRARRILRVWMDTVQL